MKRFFPAFVYNAMTLVGGGLASVSFGLIFFLFLLETLAERQKPYMGIIAFVILPAFLLLGLALVALGVIREYLRERAGRSRELLLPRLDLNDARQRTAVIFFSVASILLLMSSAFGSFKAYEYTESNAFCGEMCHKVMDPEYTAYQFSPHARVDCVECHIGAGAGWFVRSKLSGVYQMYATVFNRFPRPLPTPIENLRPAQETCEQCHWPKHFFSEKQRVYTYFLGNQENTRWTLNLLVRIGGGNIETGPTSGIHWHMNIANEVSYIALDSRREIIPWVRSKGLDGQVTIYRSTDIPVTEERLQNSRQRRMDCIDCHNRPTHKFYPPAKAVNYAMAQGWIDPRLPYAKSLAVKALQPGYTTREVALDSIKIIIEGFYQTRYPRVAASMATEINSTIEQVQQIYLRNFFPKMQVSWKGFPDQVGHLYAPGCFRCHDNKHVSESGKVLSKACNECHILLAQQLQGEQRLSLTGVEYYHPEDVGAAWREMNCSDCHRELSH